MTTIPPHDSSITSVCVVGLGYIGLPTAVFIAAKGLNVIGVDTNPDTVSAVNRGQAPFSEPDFESALAGVVARGRLVAQESMPEANAYIVAVPTPFGDDHAPDLTSIDAATRAIAPQLRGGELVVLESTSPPGTTARLAAELIRLRPDLSLDESHPRAIFLAHCPERVLPGRIMVEMSVNDRVIGGLTLQGGILARDLYAKFCDGELHLTDATTAEPAKLTENSFRDVNIAFANELSIICDGLGVDVWELIRLANRHPRVNVLQPGPGVGGHCIAVDPWFLVSADPENSRIIRAAREVNDSKPLHVLAKVADAIVREPNARLATLGLTFKADVDDIRESPALEITRRLAAAYPETVIDVVDPHLDDLPRELTPYSGVTLTTLDEALATADIVLLLVDHAEFKALDPLRLVGKTVIDTRGVWKVAARILDELRTPA